jgi:hypothetical protein
MVWSRVRPSFLAAVCGCLVGGVSVARAEPMGDLGGADRLVVRGLSAETAASLRQGLLDDGDLYWLGIPTADREPYLAALRTRVPLALEAAGFPEPRATVTVGPGPDGKEAVLIDVVAGERLTAGAIRVTGIPDDMARRLVAYLQQPQPPGDAVPETITLPDGSEKVLSFDAKGEPAKLGQPKWTPGEPAPCGERCASELPGAVTKFFSCEGYLSLAGWKDPWDDGYHDAIREHVDLKVRAEGDEAVLAIDVKRLPARTTLAGIEVNDGLRTTPADLLAYLGLDIGQPVTAADRQAWLGKLRLSGRFIKQACRFEPRGDRCVARFELVEYKRAAPLDRGDSPEQQALLRARAWLLGEWHGGREIRVRATIQREDKAGGVHGRPIRIELIGGLDTGSVVKGENGEWSCGAVSVPGTIGLFTDTQRFDGFPLPGWAPVATAKLVVAPRDQQQRLEVGWGMKCGGSAPFAFQIEPVTCHVEGWTSRRVGDDLVIETTDTNGHREIWLDPASGRPRKFVAVADSHRMEILCDSGAGLVAAAAADLRERAGENLADSHRPVSSAARFALANRSLFGDALWLATAITTGTIMDDDAIARWIESLQVAVDGDGLTAVDATVGKGIRRLRDAVANDTPEGLAIPVSTAEEMAGVREMEMFASRSAGMTAAIDGMPVARAAADERILPPLAGPSREPWMGRALGRKCAAAVAPVLRLLELEMGRDAAAVAAARAAVLMFCTADHAAAARELARVPAASLWTPELEALCAAFGPQGRNLDRRAREALAYLHGVAGDTAWSVATYRRLLAETEEQHAPNHPETAKYLHNLVWLLNQSGEVKEAYALARRPRATIAWETGLHPPVPARLKQPPAVAGKDEAKAKKPDAGKPGDKQHESSPATEFERWSGLELGTPGTRR